MIKIGMVKMLHKSKSQIGQHLGFYISKCYHAVMWPVKSTNRNETGKNAFIISPGNTLTFSFLRVTVSSHFFFEIRQGSSFAWSQKMFSKERKKVRMAMWMFRTLQPIIIKAKEKFPVRCGWIVLIPSCIIFWAIIWFCF
jgi:hypothetical protein